VTVNLAARASSYDSPTGVLSEGDPMKKKAFLIGATVATGAAIVTAALADVRVTIAKGTPAPNAGPAVRRRTHTAPPAPAPLTAAELTSAKNAASIGSGGTPVPGTFTTPLTLDMQHWKATSGAVNGGLSLGNLIAVAGNEAEFIHVNAGDGETEGNFQIGLFNLKQGQTLLLDCRVDVSSSGYADKRVKEVGNAYHAPQTIPVESGHFLYAFNADGPMHMLLFEVPTKAGSGWAFFYGCTLHPVS
jgi:hypothetical protein